MNNKVFILKSLDAKSIYLYKNFIVALLSTINIKYRVFHFPIKKKTVTLLKSPHVYKSAREQFEIRYYKMIVFIPKLSNSFVLNNLLINKPKNIQLRIK